MRSDEEIKESIFNDIKDIIKHTITPACNKDEDWATKTYVDEKIGGAINDSY